MMDQGRILITGIGVIAPNGIGKKAFWRNCRAGMSGIKPITLFDTSRYRCHLAGEISDFRPGKYLGPKGLRNLDRTTLLALVASKLALEDAKLEISEKNAQETGVVLGSTMGSVHSISSFDIEGLREGPRYVNPALFPNTVINSPASQISIRFGIKGLNSTIGTGFTAGLNALEYASDMLRLGRVKAILVGGVEELCEETFGGFAGLGLLSAHRVQSNGNGTGDYEKTEAEYILGEGAGFVVLETEDNAVKRGVRPLGEILSVASGYDPVSHTRSFPSVATVKRIVSDALRAAEVESQVLRLIVGCNSIGGSLSSQRPKNSRHPMGDISQKHRSVRPLIGECFSAMGVLELIAAIGWGHSQRWEGYENPILICSEGPTGLCAALVANVYGEQILEQAPESHAYKSSN